MHKSLTRLNSYFTCLELSLNGTFLHIFKVFDGVYSCFVTDNFSRQTLLIEMYIIIDAMLSKWNIYVKISLKYFEL